MQLEPQSCTAGITQSAQTCRGWKKRTPDQVEATTTSTTNLSYDLRRHTQLPVERRQLSIHCATRGREAMSPRGARQHLRPEAPNRMASAATKKNTTQNITTHPHAQTHARTHSGGRTGCGPTSLTPLSIRVDTVYSADAATLPLLRSKRYIVVPLLRRRHRGAVCQAARCSC